MLIFLDIDGVMAPAKSWQRPDILEDGFVDFSSKAVSVLQDILAQNPNSTIILTTSHKSRFSLSQWKIIFERRGLNVNKLEYLNDNSDFQSRKVEILNWFDSNDIHEDFIIIDDDKSLNDLPTFYKDRLILTSSLVGLNESHRADIQYILANSKNMAIFHEPPDVDFVVDPRPLSVAEEKVITDFIRANKEKRTRKDQKAKKILKSKGNLLV
jgi:hypothetical protein